LSFGSYWSKAGNASLKSKVSSKWVSWTYDKCQCKSIIAPLLCSLWVLLVLRHLKTLSTSKHLGALPFLGPHRFSPAGCPGRGGGDRGGGRRGAQRHRDNPGPFHQRLLRAARRAHTAHGGERSGHVGAPAMRVAWRARREPLKKGVVEVWGKPTAEEAGGALSDAMKTPQPVPACYNLYMTYNSL